MAEGAAFLEDRIRGVERRRGCADAARRVRDEFSSLRRKAEGSRLYVDTQSVSGDQSLAKQPRTSRKCGPLSAKYRPRPRETLETGLAGAPGSLVRTSLPPHFRVKCHLTRKLGRKQVISSPLGLIIIRLYSLLGQVFPAQQNRELKRRNREFWPEEQALNRSPIITASSDRVLWREASGTGLRAERHPTLDADRSVPVPLTCLLRRSAMGSCSSFVQGRRIWAVSTGRPSRRLAMGGRMSALGGTRPVCFRATERGKLPFVQLAGPAASRPKLPICRSPPISA
jgi:hypothetical protein